MGEFIIFAVAAVLTLPFPFFVIFYIVARSWTKQKRKAMLSTANISAPIFILAVHVMLFAIFDRSFFAYILILLLFLLGLSMIIQYKLHEEIQLKRAFKGFWRVSFLLFMLFHMGLTLFGLLARLIA